jgi:hypothetical protein
MAKLYDPEILECKTTFTYGSEDGGEFRWDGTGLEFKILGLYRWNHAFLFRDMLQDDSWYVISSDKQRADNTEKQLEEANRRIAELKEELSSTRQRIDLLLDGC